MLGHRSATPGALVVVQSAEAAGGKEACPAPLPAGLLARIKAVPGAASAEGLVAVSKVTLIGRGGHPITHSRAADELLSYPAVPALDAQYTIRACPARPGGPARPTLTWPPRAASVTASVTGSGSSPRRAFRPWR